VIEIVSDKDLIGPWVFAKVGHPWYPEGREAIGIVRDGEVLAGTIIEDYTGCCAQMHIAIAHPHVPLRKFVVAGFHYVFEYLNCRQVLGFVKSTNTKALKFDVRLGFEAIAIVPNVYPGGVDLVILRMERSRCPWISAATREAA
jgi:hypothetical protein